MKKFFKTLQMVAATTILTAGSVAAQSVMVGGAAMYPTKNIIENQCKAY